MYPAPTKNAMISEKFRKRSRCKARENPANEAYELYAAVSRGERNAADGPFSNLLRDAQQLVKLQTQAPLRVGEAVSQSLLRCEFAVRTVQRL